MNHLRQKLKATTQPLHDRVEANDVMSRLLRDDLTEALYARTLRRMHALYVPLEAQLTRVPGLKDALPDLPERMKADALAADLAALGTAPAPTVRVPPIPSVAAALGTLYVLEGSTMGGRLIAKALRARPFVTSDRLNFFSHYGEHAGRYWQTFVRVLEQVPEAGHPDALAAALATFGHFLALGDD